jgi:hypothetical protein
MSMDTHFDTESEKMYYLVREPVSGTMCKEGYADHVNLISELSDGQICVDGSIKYDLNYGDSIQILTKPEYRLKCIKFVSDSNFHN